MSGIFDFLKRPRQRPLPQQHQVWQRGPMIGMTAEQRQLQLQQQQAQLQMQQAQQQRRQQHQQQYRPPVPTSSAAVPVVTSGTRAQPPIQPVQQQPQRNVEQELQERFQRAKYKKQAERTAAEQQKQYAERKIEEAKREEERLDQELAQRTAEARAEKRREEIVRQKQWFRSTGCAEREDSAVCLLEIVSHHPDLVLCSPLGDRDSDLPTLCGSTNDEFKAYILDRNQRQIIASIDSGGHMRKYKPPIDIPEELHRPVVQPVTEQDATELQQRARTAPIIPQREQLKDEADIFRSSPQTAAASTVSTRSNVLYHDGKPFGLQEVKSNNNNNDVEMIDAEESSSSVERMLQEVRQRRESMNNNNNNNAPVSTSSPMIRSTSASSNNNNNPPPPPVRTNTARTVTGGFEADNWYVL